MKEVLVVYYSQSGQLFDLLKNVVSKIERENVNINYHQIVPEKPYDFPWKSKDFFDAFPESFLQIPCALKEEENEILQKNYDLIILGYTVWYLSPSIPINSFLKSSNGKKLLQNTSVVTVIGCRNMWVMAQEKIKILLRDCGANLVGNIAVVDRHVNHISVITIVHWMFGGKKTRAFGIFPKPGISENDIINSSRFGVPIRNSLLINDYSDLQLNLQKLKAVIIKPFLIITDKRGNAIFSKWANFIIKKGDAGDVKRDKWLVLFKYYLFFAIWVIAPIVFIVFCFTYPLFRHKIFKEKVYFSSVIIK
jgi:hypothetical protein